MNDEYHFVQAYVEWDERHYSLLNDLLLPQFGIRNSA